MNKFSTFELCCIQEKLGNKLSVEEKKALDAMFSDNMVSVVTSVLDAIKHNTPTSLITPCPLDNGLNEAIQELVSNFRNE